MLAEQEVLEIRLQHLLVKVITVEMAEFLRLQHFLVVAAEEHLLQVLNRRLRPEVVQVGMGHPHLFQALR
jgi:hypothetical protein